MSLCVKRLITTIAALLLLLSSAPAIGAQIMNTEVLAIELTWRHWDEPVVSGLAQRTWMFGFDVTATFEEDYVEAPGGKRVVQYFDKGRIEATVEEAMPDEGGVTWLVSKGLLATELITGRVQTGDAAFEQREPAAIPVAGDPDDVNGPTYATFATVIDAEPLDDGAVITQRIDRDGSVTDDPALAQYGITTSALVTETQHSIASPFCDFMQSSGVLWNAELGMQTGPLFEDPSVVIGLPVTEPYWASVKVAGTYQDVLVQCFERRCLTWTPSNAPSWQVESGNVGRHYFDWRYGDLPQPSGTIVYMGSPLVYRCSAWCGMAGDIIAFDLATMTDRNLTNTMDGEAFPEWSPNSQMIAFDYLYVAPDGTDQSDLMVMSADGSARKQVADLPGREMDVTWSPDSTMLAFTAHYGDQSNPARPLTIAVANADGSATWDLTEGWDPSWSPDGTQIAFARNDPDWDRTQVWLMNADGSNIRQVTSTATHKDTIGWTPDGSRITFWEPSGTYFSVLPNGSDQRPLWDLGDMRVRSGTLAWSPDGSRAAFIDEDHLLPYVVNVDGTGLTNVTPPFEVPENEQLGSQWARAYIRPIWSPDSQFLAYERYGWDGPIRIVNVEHPEWPHRTVGFGMDAEWSPKP